MESRPDHIFSRKLETVADFRFDENVASVFSDMISRSVPGYSDILRGISIFAEKYAKSGTNIYDLGCSLGGATFSVLDGIREKNGISVFSVDSSQAMIERLKQNIAAHPAGNGTVIHPICSDIRDVPMSDASFIVLNFTLQFIERQARQAIISSLYDALVPGGVLILSEKCREDDSFIEKIISEAHLDFKKRMGYSDLEIAQKRTALENVMKTDRTADHLDRLHRAGFSKAVMWYRQFNFCSFIAVKPAGAE
ncbi:MAG: carboxy-S-adenosyl-L-methionine synthase CmoA [Succinivibrionaceae bacterium]|jgi:tRNA (cmo5U34)-methyltransferase|nr:carboxy-S-adenosyl-L-methionine synthase CmoA [Succinivibrionaceae bacterium]MDY6273736.1 carboxy-S-adenosyl-L-methionine synthase CmoA [Succinivibrionaceae bacterium]MDY6336050.1 carboxy-S-adenosyl-L-methionine synthase CmoA [Succinivibrionaceae bacterium]MDY6376316.1 carboxy-S-adenosyl-L-methionine synthase CmoA [Succinivibrionaceae bacterium]